MDNILRKTNRVFSLNRYNFIFPVFSLWAQIVPCGGTGKDACTLCHLFILVVNIAKFIAFTLTPPIAALLFFYGGVRYVVSGGSEQNVTAARQIITKTVIGLVLIYTAWIVINLVSTTVAGPSIGWVRTGDWWMAQGSCTSAPNSQ